MGRLSALSPIDIFIVMLIKVSVVYNYILAQSGNSRYINKYMYKAKKHCPEINPLWTRNPKKGTLANSEDLDEMPNCEDPGLFWMQSN